MKISKHDIWLSFDPANFEMSKIYQGNLQSLCRLAQLFLNTSAVISKRKSEIVGGIFFQLWKCNLVNFIEISRNRDANTSFH